MVDPLFRAHVADVHHALDAFRELHERTKLREIDYWTLDRCAHRKLLSNVRPRISQSLLQSKRDTPLRCVHSENNDLHSLPWLHDVAGHAHLLGPRHLRYVDQALNAGLEFDERAELHYASYDRSHSLSCFVALRHRIPGIGQQLLQANRNAPLLSFAGDFQHLGLNRLPDTQHIGRFVDPSPGDVADM